MASWQQFSVRERPRIELPRPISRLFTVVEPYRFHIFALNIYLETYKFKIPKLKMCPSCKCCPSHLFQAQGLAKTILELENIFSNIHEIDFTVRAVI